MKVYVYCLCTDLDTFEKSVSGVSGATVRVLKIDDMSVVVSDLERVPATQENALAHAAVVRKVLEQTTPLPVRFGTLATEQQLRSFVTSHRLALKNKLEHLSGCVEMDLKIVWRRPASSEAGPDQPEQHVGPGTAFLQKKQRELVGDDRATAQRAELSSLLRADLGSLIRDETIGLRPSETMVLARVFHLVASAKIHEYREKMAALVELHPELQVTVTGPWPPYSFANIELEFKSQFGVS